LHADELRVEVEDEIVPLVAERPGNADTELECRMRDCGLGDRAFLVGREHTDILVAMSDN
jgi:hypothetical protein